MTRKIAVIGIGNVGSALGNGFAAKGHTVTFGLRDPGSAKNKAALAAIGPTARAATVAGAVASAEIVVLATPWPATKQAIESAGDLAGKILVDCINPISDDLKSLVVGTSSSAAEMIASWAPKALVVKAFNTTGADNMRNPVYGKSPLFMPICGNDKKAKSVVIELASDIGFDTIDAGPLHVARFLEPAAMLWIHMAIFEKFGTGFGFQLIRR